MKDDKWIINKMEETMIEMSFLFTDDTDEANRYTECMGKLEVLKEVLE